MHFTCNKNHSTLHNLIIRQFDHFFNHATRLTNETKIKMTSKNLVQKFTTLGLPIFRQSSYLKNYPRSISTLGDVCNRNPILHQLCRPKPEYLCATIKYFSTEDSPPKKLGLVARFKQMYRDYWYVLVPVHLITSIGWFTGFYYLAKRFVWFLR